MSKKFDENKWRNLAMNKPDELHSYVPQSSINELFDEIERLEKENFRLKEANEDVQSRLDDYRNDVSRVLDEKCPSDERHCGCVPILRDQLNKYQKALILITTMPELSQATTIAREALQERGKFIWTEQSVGEYWVTKLDILQDKFDTLEKDYADVCQKRLEAADVFSRQIIELESRIAELEAAQKEALSLLPELEQGHYYCDDCWYSCPKAADGCCDESQGDECNCGADNYNALLAKIIGLLTPEVQE